VIARACLESALDITTLARKLLSRGFPPVRTSAFCRPDHHPLAVARNGSEGVAPGRIGASRRMAAVGATSPLPRRSGGGQGVARNEPVGNGGSPVDTRPSLSTPLGFQRLRDSADRDRRQLPHCGLCATRRVGV
jgi:hypothetical protein